MKFCSANDVLENFVHGMANVEVAIGIRRPVMQDKRLRVFPFLSLPLI
jgi:hypothetical protein